MDYVLPDGRSIMYRRQRLGLSKSDVARIVGCSQPAVASIENGFVCRASLFAKVLAAIETGRENRHWYALAECDYL